MVHSRQLEPVTHSFLLHTTLPELLNQSLSQTLQCSVKKAYFIRFVLDSVRVAWDQSNTSKAGLIWSECSCSRSEHLSAIHFRLVLKSAAQSISMLSLEL